jgi:hypothetical protein
MLYRFPFGLVESTFLEIDTAADAIMKSFLSIDRGTKVIICDFIGQLGGDETFEVEGKKLFIQLAPVYRVFASGEGPMVDVEMFTDTHAEVEPTRG